jgi:hypothetical protein
MQSIILSPAYGRDYKSKAALLADWESGKDFILHSIWESGYCSIRDIASLAEQGIDSISFRYGGMRKVFILTVGILA